MIDIALSNNAAFAEQLAGLGLSRADVVQAGLIANPDALLLIPVGPKQLEATITAPLESLWLRKARVEAATASAERSAALLTQAALDLIRDVRLACADLALARRRLALFEESAGLRRAVSRVVDVRVRAGDASRLEQSVSEAELLRSEQEARSLRLAAAVAEERLRALMGVGRVRTPLALAPADEPAAASGPADALVGAAIAGRPDVCAAGLAVDAARSRAQLARIDWIAINFLADANERGSEGFEVGPGFRFTLPIFNRNQGQIARADAELERTLAQKRAAEDRVILEVRESHARYAQALEDADAWRTRILPALERVATLAERSYQAGEAPLIQVLDAQRQLLDARTREAESADAARRARAELERSVGHRLDAPPASPVPSTTSTTRPALQETRP